MGGKSRKSGGVSKRLIAKLAGNKGGKSRGTKTTKEGEGKKATGLGLSGVSKKE